MIGLFILVALVIYVWLARFVAKRIKNRIAKYAVIAIFILIPTWDIIPGKLYFKYVCEKEGGMKFYKTVELPAEYWDEQGKPKFLNKQGYPDLKLMKEKLYEPAGRIEQYSTVLEIDKVTSLVKERASQDVLAEVTTFHLWGGWVSRNFSPHNTAISCEFIQDYDFSRNFYGGLFKAATSTR